MRENPPGRRNWTDDELDAKRRFNEQKLKALTAIREFDGYFGSADIAENLDITREHAAMILLRLRRQGLIVPAEDVRVVPPDVGPDPIIYTATDMAPVREQLLRVKVGFRVSKKQGKRQKRSLEL